MNKYLFNTIFFIIYFISVSVTGNGFFWPVSKNIDERITSLFGESRGDHFHNGIDISSNREEVLSIGDGKLVYSSYAEDRPFENETGPGNLVWIAHDKGIMSAYYHLRDGRIKSLIESEKISKGDVIGYSGNTGHSGGPHIHFLVTDGGGRVIYNPLSLLPQVSDIYPPEISALLVHTGDRFSNIRDGDNITISQKFPVTIRIKDPGLFKNQNRGVKKVTYFLNEKKIGEYSFDRIKYEQGKWINTEERSFDDLYYKNDYLIGSLMFRSGENNVKVVAEDYAGMRSEKGFAFYVTLE